MALGHAVGSSYGNQRAGTGYVPSEVPQRNKVTRTLLPRGPRHCFEAGFVNLQDTAQKLYLAAATAAVNTQPLHLLQHAVLQDSRSDGFCLVRVGSREEPQRPCSRPVSCLGLALQRKCR
jgi:hypothetical protein